MARRATCLRSTWLAVFTFLLAVPACGGSNGGSTGSDGGTGAGSGSASSLGASCERARTRASTCFASDPQRVTEEGDEDCQQIDACYGKVYREAVREDVATCIASRECTTGYGKCLDDIASSHASEEGIPAFLSRCKVRATECNEPQNTYLTSSDCNTYALALDRTSFEACIPLPCNQIGPCLGGLMAACDR